MSVNGLEGQVVIVTGASSGLGEQLARALAARAPCRCWPRAAPSGSRRCTADIPGADTVTCDVTDEDDRQRLVDTVMERHGRIDGLVNNAGAGATGPALRTPAETFARVVDLNLTAPFALSCLAAQHMRNGNGSERAVDRQHRLGHGPALDRRDPRRGVRRLEGRDHRPDARARLPVGALRDPRQRGRARASSPPR